MASWVQIIREASSVLDSEIPNWKKEEEDYELLKKMVNGKPIPSSTPRKNFLAGMNRWTYTVLLDKPELTVGQARRLGKEEFFKEESGAPKFFVPQGSFKLKSIEAEKSSEGWIVTVNFTAEFKSVKGKRLTPTAEELSRHGFESAEPEPEEEVFIIHIRIPLSSGSGETKRIHTDVELEGAMKAEFKKQVLKFFQKPKVLGIVQRKDDPTKNNRLYAYAVKGIPAIDYNDRSTMKGLDIVNAEDIPNIEDVYPWYHKLNI